jgi:hypothetical protein
MWKVYTLFGAVLLSVAVLAGLWYTRMRMAADCSLAPIAVISHRVEDVDDKSLHTVFPSDTAPDTVVLFSRYTLAASVRRGYLRFEYSSSLGAMDEVLEYHFKLPARVPYEGATFLDISRTPPQGGLPKGVNGASENGKAR